MKERKDGRKKRVRLVARGLFLIAGTLAENNWHYSATFATVQPTEAAAASALKQ